MKQEKKIELGGFASTNQGSICDCYTVVQSKRKSSILGVFSGKNTGNITHCYSTGIEKGTLKAAFIGNEETGDISDCYVMASTNAVEPQFDFNIWEKGDREIPYRFVNEKWQYEIDLQSIQGKPEIYIRSSEDLYEFAKRVNQGDASAQEAYVVLEADLDLKGKEWIPIGQDFGRTFNGILDGKGHIIKNYLISGKDLEFKGFFGVLRGEVYNLTVDGALKGNGCLGGFVAQNEGVIGCCASLVSISANNSEAIGGFVGRNKGKIFQSYAAGKVHFLVISKWVLIGTIVGVLIGGTVFAFWQNNSKDVFNPIPVDVGQEKLPEKPEEKKDDKGRKRAKNNVSYSINQTLKLDLKTGVCTINLQNPSASDKDFVAEIVLKNANSDKETLVVKTGSLEPGNQIKTVTVERKVLDLLSPGSYEAVVHLSFYDTADHSLAIVKANLGVVLEVS